MPQPPAASLPGKAAFWMQWTGVNGAAWTLGGLAFGAIGPIVTGIGSALTLVFLLLAQALSSLSLVLMAMGVMLAGLAVGATFGAILGLAIGVGQRYVLRSDHALTQHWLPMTIWSSTVASAACGACAALVSIPLGLLPSSPIGWVIGEQSLSGAALLVAMGVVGTAAVGHTQGKMLLRAGYARHRYAWASTAGGLLGWGLSVILGLEFLRGLGWIWLGVSSTEVSSTAILSGLCGTVYGATTAPVLARALPWSIEGRRQTVAGALILLSVAGGLGGLANWQGRQLCGWLDRAHQQSGCLQLIPVGSGLNNPAPMILSPDGSLMASLSKDGTAAATLRKMPGGEIAFTIATGSQTPESAQFSPDGRLLALGLSNGSVEVWDLETYQLHATLQISLPLRSDVSAVAFSPTAMFLAAGATVQDATVEGTGTVFVWRLQDNVQVAVLPGPTNQVDALAFAPDGARLAAACLERIELWEVPDWNHISTLDAGSAGAIVLAWAPNGEWLASGGIDGAYLWYGADYGSVRSWLPDEEVDAVAFVDDSSVVTTVSHDSLGDRLSLRRWRVTSGAELASWRAPVPSSLGIGTQSAWSERRKLLVVSVAWGQAAVFDVNGRETSSP